MRAGRETRVELYPHEDLVLSDGEVLVPGGVAVLGVYEGHEDHRAAFVPAFVIARRPVSVRAYLEFVSEGARAAGGPDPSLLPSSADGVAYWRWEGERFVPSPSCPYDP